MRIALLICLMAGSIMSAKAEVPALSIGALGTKFSIEQNLDALNQVKHQEMEGSFSDAWSGVTPDGWQVLLFLKGDQLGALSVTKSGSFAENDRADILDVEKDFGLSGMKREFGTCGAAFKDMHCVAILYACPNGPPICHITLRSFSTEGSPGRTRLDWSAEPRVITNK